MLIPNIDLQNKSILITGAAGFIGANLVMEQLFQEHSFDLVVDQPAGGTEKDCTVV